jgi:hypothetical protein
LNPLIGYSQGASLVKESQLRRMTIAELAIEKAIAGELRHRDGERLVSAEEIQSALKDLRRLTEGGIIA